MNRWRKNLTSDEVFAFQENWDKNWNPSFGQLREGGVKEEYVRI
jgi:hypothetical protein